MWLRKLIRCQPLVHSVLVWWLITAWANLICDDERDDLLSQLEEDTISTAYHINKIWVVEAKHQQGRLQSHHHKRSWGGRHCGRVTDSGVTQISKLLFRCLIHTSIKSTRTKWDKVRLYCTQGTAQTLRGLRWWCDWYKHNKVKRWGQDINHCAGRTENGWSCLCLGPAHNTLGHKSKAYCGDKVFIKGAWPLSITMKPLLCIDTPHL